MQKNLKRLMLKSNKYRKKLLSLLLSCVLILSSTSVAFNVSAAVPTVKQDWVYRHYISPDTYYYLSSILAWQGVQISPESFAYTCFGDYFDYLLENLDDVFYSQDVLVSNDDVFVALDALVNNNVSVIPDKPFLNVQTYPRYPPDRFFYFKVVFNSLSNYFTVERFAQSVADENVHYIDPSFSDKSDVFDLSISELFSIDYSNVDFSHFNIYKTKMNKCYFTLYTACPAWKRMYLESLVSESQLTDSFKNNNAWSVGNYFRVEPLANNDEFQLALFTVRNLQLSNTVYYNSSFNRLGSFGYWDFSFHNITNTSSFVAFGTGDFYDNKNSKRYTIRKSDIDNKVHFVNFYDSNDFYKNLSFDSAVQAFDYALSSYGLTADFDIPEPSDDDVGTVDIDEDRQQQIITYVNNYDIDNNEFVFVYPANEQTFQILSANPDTFHNPHLIDDSDVDYYFSDIPIVTTTSLSSKFPFCLAFDFVHLFSNFSAEAVSVPSIDILILPDDFLGLGNEAFYYTLDFTQYNSLVQILRFFIALSFTVSLILVTKKILF